MRLLHVITSLDQGGSEGYLRQLAPRLGARGIAQHVVSMVSGGFHAAGLQEAGVPVTELGMRRGLPDPRGLWALRRALAEFRPDIVQGWLYHANLLAMAANAMSGRRRVPLIWGIRSAEMDQSRYGLGLRVAVGASARLSRFADCVVANSAAGRADHVRLGFAADRFTVIPNGIDTARFAPDPGARAAVRAALGLAPDARLAGVFARNDPMKNLPQIVAAVGRVKGLETLFAGVDTDRLPAAAGCHFLGARRDVPVLMAACDFTILASKSEGFPNVVAESLACGVPVISADVGDAALILGGHGEIFPAEDWAALDAALARYSAKPAEMLAQTGAEGRRHVADTYSIAASVDRYCSLYDGLKISVEKSK